MGSHYLFPRFALKVTYGRIYQETLRLQILNDLNWSDIPRVMAWIKPEQLILPLALRCGPWLSLPPQSPASHRSWIDPPF